MNRANMILRLVSLVIGLSLVGIMLWQQFEILKLQGRIEELLLEKEQLEEAYEQLVKYFFIEDSGFTIPLNENPYWNVEAWHENPDSISEIKKGILHLFYNETKGDWFGNSGAFQGRHPDGRRTFHPLLVGRSTEEANSSDYVIFPKSMLSRKFWLEVRFRILKIGFNRFPSALDPHARVNLGITLMCAINDEPFNSEAQTLWLDIYFAGYSLNENDIWVINKDEPYVAYHDDVHAGYFVGEVSTSDFGEWITTSIDLGGYINKTISLTTEIDIKTIRVYGFIVFAECLGAYAEVEYDYIETRNQ